MLERLVLKNNNPHTPLCPTQHGCRSHHSTSTLLTNLTQNISEGFNQPKLTPRTLVAAIDISKAFETVPCNLLIQKILNTDMHPSVEKWLANFLSGRQAHTEYNGKPSTTRHYTSGVRQGSVLSQTLFNLYTHYITAPPDPNSM